jgi:hypothetical protein
MLPKKSALPNWRSPRAPCVTVVVQAENGAGKAAGMPE